MSNWPFILSNNIYAAKLCSAYTVDLVRFGHKGPAKLSCYDSLVIKRYHEDFKEGFVKYLEVVLNQIKDRFANQSVTQ